MAADAGVQGGASGGEGVAEDAAGARGVRQAYRYWQSEGRVEAGPCDAAVGSHALLLRARDTHACCAVRGTVVVLGGITPLYASDTSTSSVEMLSGEQGAFMNLPSLSCAGGICLASAIAADESDSAAGQVLLLEGLPRVREMHLVDLATGTCTRQPDMLHSRYNSAAAWLKDGRVVCAGGGDHPISAEVCGPPVQGASDAPWTWTELPAMSVPRYGCCGCVLSDGRFAVLGGMSNIQSTSSCEALVVGDDAHWAPLAPMHESREYFACAAVAGCVVVAPVGMITHQPKSTTRCWIGGFGFRVTYLTTVMIWATWVACFCSRSMRLRA